MNITRLLSTLANNTSAVYRIVFTGMLMYELIRFRLAERKRSEKIRPPNFTDGGFRSRYQVAAQSRKGQE